MRIFRIAGVMAVGRWDATLARPYSDVLLATSLFFYSTEG